MLDSLNNNTDCTDCLKEIIAKISSMYGVLVAIEILINKEEIK